MIRCACTSGLAPLSQARHSRKGACGCHWRTSPPHVLRHDVASANARCMLFIPCTFIFICSSLPSTRIHAWSGGVANRHLEGPRDVTCHFTRSRSRPHSHRVSRSQTVVWIGCGSHASAARHWASQCSEKSSGISELVQGSPGSRRGGGSIAIWICTCMCVAWQMHAAHSLSLSDCTAVTCIEVLDPADRVIACLESRSHVAGLYRKV